MNGFRLLSPEEIEMLKSRSCAAEDWNRILVAEGFSARYVRNVRFSGDVRLGAFRKDFAMPGGIR